MAVLDLVGIKNEIKSIFDAANTTTASPLDLSNGMSKRVKQILTYHPQMIKPQASYDNFVTCYVVDKNRVGDDIAVNQVLAKRESDIQIEIVGCVYVPNITTNTKDPADDEINYLMENIEQVLRQNPNLNGKVKWQKTDSVRYYISQLDHQTHLRAGILRLTAKVFY